jgi:protein arginine kinase activator
MKEGSENVCAGCGAEPATIHLTEVVDNKSITSHLCEACAAEKGVHPPPSPGSLPLIDFLAKMGGPPPPDGPAPDEDLVCPYCGLTASAFKEVGRLGCPQCYTTFENSLRGLLRRIHGGTQHVGKVYLPPDPSLREAEQRLDGLRRRLQRAIDTEDFERAADLRDEIRSLEPAV